jgi:phosphofructokinase-like protein
MQEVIMHIGMLTGGGDAPGLNAVIRAVVKTAISKYEWQVTGIEDGFDGLIERAFQALRPMTLKDVRGILPQGGTILGAANRGNPFARQVMRDGQAVIEDASALVIERLRVAGIEALVVVGGDGTLRIGQELYEKGCPVVGVPKTIDNDLGETDVTFGFDTALNTATDAIDKLHTTAEAHHRVMVVEVMGRDAGWIALHSGIAGGADVILIPEIPFNWDVVAEAIKARSKGGAKFSIIVAAEGARPADGQQVFRLAGDGVTTVARLGGIGNQVAERLQTMTGLETRCTVLGHVQRGGRPTPFDRLLATRYGAAAVRLVADGKFGHMVALRGSEIAAVPIAEAIRVPKRINPESERVYMARDMGVCFG